MANFRTCWPLFIVACMPNLPPEEDDTTAASSSTSSGGEWMITATVTSTSTSGSGGSSSVSSEASSSSQGDECEACPDQCVSGVCVGCEFEGCEDGLLCDPATHECVVCISAEDCHEDGYTTCTADQTCGAVVCASDQDCATGLCDLSISRCYGKVLFVSSSSCIESEQIGSSDRPYCKVSDAISSTEEALGVVVLPGNYNDEKLFVMYRSMTIKGGGIYRDEVRLRPTESSKALFTVESAYLRIANLAMDLEGTTGISGVKIEPKGNVHMERTLMWGGHEWGIENEGGTVVVERSAILSFGMGGITLAEGGTATTLSSQINLNGFGGYQGGIHLRDSLSSAQVWTSTLYGNRAPVGDFSPIICMDSLTHVEVEGSLLIADREDAEFDHRCVVDLFLVNRSVLSGPVPPSTDTNDSISLAELWNFFQKESNLVRASNDAPFYGAWVEQQDNDPQMDYDGDIRRPLDFPGADVPSL